MIMIAKKMLIPVFGSVESGDVTKKEIVIERTFSSGTNKASGNREQTAPLSPKSPNFDYFGKFTFM